LLHARKPVEQLCTRHLTRLHSCCNARQDVPVSTAPAPAQAQAHGEAIAEAPAGGLALVKRYAQPAAITVLSVALVVTMVFTFAP
jgi:hypothetical protein